MLSGNNNSLIIKLSNGSVSVNLSDPPCKDDLARFTEAPLESLLNQQYISCPFFKFSVSHLFPRFYFQ